jgi:hypothetical protein
MIVPDSTNLNLLSTTYHLILQSAGHHEPAILEEVRRVVLRLYSLADGLGQPTLQ